MFTDPIGSLCDLMPVVASASITEVHWRGGYEQHPSGTGQSPVYDFEVSILRCGIVVSLFVAAPRRFHPSLKRPVPGDRSDAEQDGPTRGFSAAA